MRKLSILALVAAFLVSGAAFADGRRIQPDASFPGPNATFTPGVGGALGGPAGAIGPGTTNNDDSCDIGTAPAATLLLPYFEVDLGTAGTGRTTVFSVTNVSPFAQIAHVTLWTDWSFPVLDFNLFLTGYDVQPINLYDIIARGFIGSTTGTSTSSPNASSTTGTTANGIAGGDPAEFNGTNPNIGTQPFLVESDNFNGNPNFLSNAFINCAPGRLPGQLPPALLTDVRALLTVGTSTGSGISCRGGAANTERQVGGNHGANLAIGYATIDVAATCSVALPTDPSYFSGEILFDNVLIGDYQDINQSTTAGNYAGGNPLVHIRAVPEGGAANVAAVPTNLPFTFYDRYTVGAGVRTIDRRQPLPSAFAARWISGSTGGFDTQYKIWREGYTTGSGGPLFGCTLYAAFNQSIPLVEIVRFDERENAGVAGSGVIVSPPTLSSPTTPETSRQSINSGLFPIVPGSTDAGGWTYFNLSNGGNATATAPSASGGLGLTAANRPYSAQRAGFGTGAPVLNAGSFGRDVSQNWVILAMFAEGRYGVDQDANWLGNGCSPAFPSTSSGVANFAIGRIAPAGGVLVCPGSTVTIAAGVVSVVPPVAAGGTTQVFGNVQCTGTNVTP